MFSRFVYEKSFADYEKRILLWDTDNLESKTHYCDEFQKHGFQVIHYVDDLHLRVEHEEVLTNDTDKIALLVKNDAFVPYDVARRFRSFDVSISNLFSRLNTFVLKENSNLNYDMLSIAYDNSYGDMSDPEKTMAFSESLSSYSTVSLYLREKMELLGELVSVAKTYKDWFQIADLKTEVDVTAVMHGIDVDTSSTNDKFVEFVLTSFGKLSAVIDKESPVLVSKAMDYMHNHSEKYAIVVMDGMSSFDWKLIAQGFFFMRYEKTDVCAMIPTTTSVSRQCLLSGKYPSQLIEPWKQSQEKNEFILCAKDLGFTDSQIGYARGYDAEFDSSVKCAAVIINDVDNMVHGQTQGRIGMKNDVGVLAKQGKLVNLVKQLRGSGFDVYITADHGNTPCTGMGRLMKSGVETETKSRRMIVLKDFADKESLLGKYELIDYPKYYLDKKYDYLICKPGCSFDVKGEEVMSHGGITVDEVIVPFVKIKAGV